MLISHKCTGLQWLPASISLSFSRTRSLPKLVNQSLSSARSPCKCWPSSKLAPRRPRCTARLSRSDRRDLEVTPNDSFDTSEDGSNADTEEVEAFLDPGDLDPDGTEFTLDDFYAPREGTPQSLIDQLYDQNVYGPPVRSPAAVTYVCSRPPWSISSIPGHLN